MSPLGAAKKYARALFLQAQADKNVDAVGTALEDVFKAIEAQPELREALVHPFFNEQKKAELIQLVAGPAAPKLVLGFLDILVQKRRISLLELILKEFNAEADRARGVTPFSVVSAYPLSDASKKILVDYLSKRMDGTVRLEDLQVNPELLGGLIAKSRDHVVDLSLVGQLNAMKQTFLSN